MKQNLLKQHQKDLHDQQVKEADDKKLEEIAKTYRAKLLAEDK